MVKWAKPSTLNPQPSTLNPKQVSWSSGHRLAMRLNPKPQTPNP